MRPGRGKPGDTLVFILIGLISSIVMISAYWYRPGFLATLDLKAADAMSAARKASRPPSYVIIVAIDEKSVNELGRWPWTRKTTAGLISALKGARVVALDMVFSEKEDQESDGALSKAIADAGNVVSGFFFRDDSTADPEPSSLAEIERSRIKIIHEAGGPGESVFPGPAFSGVETNLKGITQGALGFGAFNIIPQEDGLYRSVNLLYGYNDGIYPALPLDAIAKYLGGDIVVSIAPYGVESVTVSGAAVPPIPPIPVDEEGALLINFYGRGGSFTTLSASDVIKGRVQPESIRDKLVFVGVTEKGVYDIRPTPVDSLFPGVELHASAAAGILERRFLIRDSRVVIYDLFMVIFMPFILSIMLSRTRRTFVSLAISSALFVFLIIFDFFLFSAYGIRAGVIFPALSLAISYLSSEAYRNVVVEKKSRYLRKAFSTYVSSQLVCEILKDPARLKLGGEKRVVTVLFSDIRGFTGLSERLSPEELVKLLNEYLNPMTGIVLDEEGMLDKYIGDAIMAVFNAPLAIPDHPRRACAAALRMASRLSGLNEDWGRLGYPGIEIGIGINTGEAVVGNMGAELRFDYTAIGDTVNLASRIEGMTKLYGAGIMISEHTHSYVKDDFLLREIDLVRVKGREKPILMYELMGPDGGDESLQELKRTFERAVRLYRERRFEEARGLFEGLLERFPGDGPSALYIKRCAGYLKHPPPEDWDGCFVATSK